MIWVAIVYIIGMIPAVGVYYAVEDNPEGHEPILFALIWPVVLATFLVLFPFAFAADVGERWKNRHEEKP